VLWDGVNDTDDDARRLAALLAGPARARQPDPAQPFAGNTLTPPAPERVLAFQKIVHDAGVRCLVRWPRGRGHRGGLRDSSRSLVRKRIP
jgi:23S rRNA (adenine2503-C2)-methyltransferase